MKTLPVRVFEAKANIEQMKKDEEEKKIKLVEEQEKLQTMTEKLDKLN